METKNLHFCCCCCHFVCLFFCLGALCIFVCFSFEEAGSTPFWKKKWKISILYRTCFCYIHDQNKRKQRKINTKYWSFWWTKPQVQNQIESKTMHLCSSCCNKHIGSMTMQSPFNRFESQWFSYHHFYQFEVYVNQISSAGNWCFSNRYILWKM